MTWTNLSWNDGDVLSSAEMTQLQANLDAVYAGDSGSPVVRAAAIDKEITFSVIELTLTAYDTYVLEPGWYSLVTYEIPGDVTMSLQVYHAGAWVTVTRGWWSVLTDGTKYRVYNFQSGTYTIRLIKVS